MYEKPSGQGEDEKEEEEEEGKAAEEWEESLAGGRRGPFSKWPSLSVFGMKSARLGTPQCSFWFSSYFGL